MDYSPNNSRTWSRHIQNIAVMYGIENPLLSINREPPNKKSSSEDALVKITAFHEKQLRTAANNNSKMKYLNVKTTGLNGRPHPALLGVNTTQGVCFKTAPPFENAM